MYRKHLEKKNDELTAQVERLSNQVFLLQKELEEKDGRDGVELKEQSKEMIRAFVEEMLQNENININGFPDVIEKKIYENVFTLLVEAISNILKKSDVEFLNHKIVFDIVPNVN